MAESLKKATVRERAAPARRTKQLMERFLTCLWVKCSGEKVFPLLPRPERGGKEAQKPRARVLGEDIPRPDHNRDRRKARKLACSATARPSAAQATGGQGQGTPLALGIVNTTMLFCGKSPCGYWLEENFPPWPFSLPQAPALSTCLGDVSAISTRSS